MVPRHTVRSDSSLGHPIFQRRWSVLYNPTEWSCTLIRKHTHLHADTLKNQHKNPPVSLLRFAVHSDNYDHGWLGVKTIKYLSIPSLLPSTDDSFLLPKYGFSESGFFLKMEEDWMTDSKKFRMVFRKSMNLVKVNDHLQFYSFGVYTSMGIFWKASVRRKAQHHTEGTSSSTTHQICFSRSTIPHNCPCW